MQELPRLWLGSKLERVSNDIADPSLCWFQH